MDTNQNEVRLPNTRNGKHAALEEYIKNFFTGSHEPVIQAGLLAKEFSPTSEPAQIIPARMTSAGDVTVEINGRVHNCEMTEIVQEDFMIKSKIKLPESVRDDVDSLRDEIAVSVGYRIDQLVWNGVMGEARPAERMMGQEFNYRRAYGMEVLEPVDGDELEDDASSSGDCTDEPSFMNRPILSRERIEEMMNAIAPHLHEVRYNYIAIDSAPRPSYSRLMPAFRNSFVDVLDNLDNRAPLRTDNKTDCQYYKGSKYLKCAVNPVESCSECSHFIAKPEPEKELQWYEAAVQPVVVRLAIRSEDSYLSGRCGSIWEGLLYSGEMVRIRYANGVLTANVTTNHRYSILGIYRIECGGRFSNNIGLEAMMSYLGGVLNFDEDIEIIH